MHWATNKCLQKRCLQQSVSNPKQFEGSKANHKLVCGWVAVKPSKIIVDLVWKRATPKGFNLLIYILHAKAASLVGYCTLGYLSFEIHQKFLMSLCGDKRPLTLTADPLFWVGVSNSHGWYTVLGWYSLANVVKWIVAILCIVPYPIVPLTIYNQHQTHLQFERNFCELWNTTKHWLSITKKICCGRYSE